MLILCSAARLNGRAPPCEVPRLSRHRGIAGRPQFVRALGGSILQQAHIAMRGVTGAYVFVDTDRLNAILARLALAHKGAVGHRRSTEKPRQAGREFDGLPGESCVAMSLQ